MKKPEPRPVIIWCCSTPGGRLPNCRKNFSNGEPFIGGGRNDSSPWFEPDELDPSSILTRTEMTAGLTLATKSAKPRGPCSPSDACAAGGPSMPLHLPYADGPK